MLFAGREVGVVVLGVARRLGVAFGGIGLAVGLLLTSGIGFGEDVVAPPGAPFLTVMIRSPLPPAETSIHVRPAHSCASLAFIGAQVKKRATRPDNFHKLRLFAKVGMRESKWLEPPFEIYLIELCKTSAMATRDGDGWIDCRCGNKHWGRFGAAGLLLFSGGRVLLQHRAPWVHNGDTWGIPGGARDSHESALEAALRESEEEIGLDLSEVESKFSHLDDHGDWAYETIVAQLHLKEAAFSMNREVLDLRWIEIAKVNEFGLHPSFARTWPDISDRLRDILDPNV